MPTRFATADLIAACMASTCKDRLGASIARPIGVGRAGHGAAWSKRLAETQLTTTLASEASTYERLRMAHEDFLSAKYGERCAEEARALDSIRNAQLMTATYHAIKLQARFRGWFARCKCAIKRREQKYLWQDFRRRRKEEQRQKALDEIEAQKAQAELDTQPSESAMRMQRISQMCKMYAFQEDEWNPNESLFHGESLIGGRASVSVPQLSALLGSASASSSAMSSPTAAASSSTMLLSPLSSRLPSEAVTSPQIAASKNSLENNELLKVDEAVSSPEMSFSSKDKNDCDSALDSTAESTSLSRKEDSKRIDRYDSQHHLSVDELLYNPLSSNLTPVASPSNDASKIGIGLDGHALSRRYMEEANKDAEELYKAGLRDRALRKNLKRPGTRPFARQKTVVGAKEWHRSETSQMAAEQPKLRLTYSIKFTKTEDAAEMLRTTFLNNRNDPGVLDQSDYQYEVIDKYLECCDMWKSKPNSQVLAELSNAEPYQTDSCHKWWEIQYDFQNAHLGDRGGSCLLIALALDPRLSSLSLRNCSLRSGSGPVICTFIEMHPKLERIDLSHNSLSFQFGENLLEALDKRKSRHSSREKDRSQLDRRQKTSLFSRVDSELTGIKRRVSSTSIATMSQMRPPPVKDIMVNLESTWFTWNCTRGFVCGAPCGNLWAGSNDARQKLSPSGLEELRSKLEDSERIHFGIPPGDCMLPRVSPATDPTADFNSPVATVLSQIQHQQVSLLPCI
jgi:hypothetical protein